MTTETSLYSIGFPNTVSDNDKTFYTTDQEGILFDIFYENGEMAQIKRIRITKYGKLLAEIKHSVCDLYYK